MVYPSANHTRFEHSLGTLEMAQRIIDGVNRNSLKAQSTKTITEHSERIVRFAALLHDLPHVPFGHTIEDDLILQERHDSKDRLARALDKEAELGGLLNRTGLLSQVHAVLAAKGDEEVAALADTAYEPPIAPFMADIVNNTICADLLDYIRRDTYFTGIKAAFDPRIFDYFEVVPSSGRLAIRIEHKGRYRTAVMSEILNILRARYTLAERMIFHHTNQAIAAMLGRALLDWDGLENYGAETLSDFEFLHLVEAEGGDVAGNLIARILSRNLHKQVFVRPRAEAEIADQVTQLEKDFRKQPEQRLAFESELEEEFEMPLGSLITHCPPGDMALKQANVRVIVRGNEAQSLRKIKETPTRKEVEELDLKYRSLWSFQAFLAPEFLFLERDVSEYLEGKLLMHNDLRRRQKSFWEVLGRLRKAYNDVANSEGWTPGETRDSKMRTYATLRGEIQTSIRKGKLPTHQRDLAKRIRELLV